MSCCKKPTIKRSEFERKIKAFIEQLKENAKSLGFECTVEYWQKTEDMIRVDAAETCLIEED